MKTPIEIVVLGPLQGAAIEWLDVSARARHTIIAKTTYALAQGCSPIVQPLAINEVDNHWNDDPARSVRAPSDLAPFKPSAEVTLTGQAFAPGGRPVTSLRARLIAGDIEKVIEVAGDRVATDGAELPAPAPFRQLPLRWERAAGGPGTSNPVGVSGDRDVLGRRTLPNLVPPETQLERGDETILTIGFGPIGALWPDRLARRGRGVVARESSLPRDLDPAFFLAAPSDQRCSSLRPDERIVLENLHATHARLVTNLEAAVVVAFLERWRGAPQAIELVPDSLWIDTDSALCTLTWRLALEERAAAPARVLFGLQRPGERLAYADLARRADKPWSAEICFEETVAPDREHVEPTMPFVSAPRERATTIVQAAARLADAMPFRSVPPPELAPPSLPREATSREAIVRTAEPVSPWALGAAVPPPEMIAPAETRAPVSDVAPIARPDSSPPSARVSVELLWLDEPSAPPIRRAFASVLESLEAPVIDAADDPRVDVSDVLVNGAPLDDAELAAAIDAALDARGRFRAPIVLVAGVLVFRFAAVDHLRAVTEAAEPFGASDKRVREALDDAKRVAESATFSASLAVESALGRVRDAVLASGRQQALDAVSAAAETELLQGRRYQRRTLFGGEHLRCALVTSGRAAVPAYLPAHIASSLPQYARLPARVIAEAHLPQEQSEPSGSALRVLALGRTIQPRSRYETAREQKPTGDHARAQPEPLVRMR